MSVTTRFLAAWAVELKQEDFEQVPGALGEELRECGGYETLGQWCETHGGLWETALGGNFLTGQPASREFLLLSRLSTSDSYWAFKEGACQDLLEVFGSPPVPTEEESKVFAQLQEELGFLLPPLKPWIITSVG